MDEQNNRITNVPAKTNSRSKTLLIVVVVIGLVMLGGLIYTNVTLARMSKKAHELDGRITKVDELSGQVDQVLKTGANDKILGFDKVDKDGYQAAFLTGGQVYFGKITEITAKNIVMKDIYYLKAGGSGSDQSLVKLGCELHKPKDELVIVRSSLQLWENLKSDDKMGVVDAIKDYKAKYPDGQKCN